MNSRLYQAAMGKEDVDNVISTSYKWTLNVDECVNRGKGNPELTRFPFKNGGAEGDRTLSDL